MLGSVNQSNLRFKGTFEIEELPLKKFRQITMNIHPEHLDEMSKILPRVKMKVEKELPPGDKIEFKLFRSLFFGDTRYKMNYVPGEESKKYDLKPQNSSNWPRNITCALGFVDNISNSYKVARRLHEGESIPANKLNILG